MPYNNVISRTEADVFIPVEQATEVLQAALVESAALRFFPHVQMSAKQRRMPVASALPVAYFVNGDTGLKQTTEMNWTSKMLEAEELAAIVPIPEAVLDDTDINLWDQIRPRLAEAIGKALDAAIFFGTNKPATWAAAVIPAAVTAGNVYVRGTNATAAGGIAADVSGLFSLVEADGYAVDGFVANPKYKGLLRNARDAQGVLLSEVSQGTIYGVPISYALPGAWPTGAGANEAVAGDFTQGILGIRQDLTYKVLDQAVITDAAGLVIFNLPQQDMVALRVTARFGWQVANAPTPDNPNDATRYPFAVMNAP